MPCAYLAAGQKPAVPAPPRQVFNRSQPRAVSPRLLCDASSCAACCSRMAESLRCRATQPAGRHPLDRRSTEAGKSGPTRGHAMRTDALVGPTARPPSRLARFRRAALWAGGPDRLPRRVGGRAGRPAQAARRAAHVRARRLRPHAAVEKPRQPVDADRRRHHPPRRAGRQRPLAAVAVAGPHQPREPRARAPDRRAVDGPVARAGDPRPLHELHPHRHRPVAAAAGDGHAKPSAEPGAGRPRAVHDLSGHGPDVGAHQRRGAAAVPRRRHDAAGRPGKVGRAAAGSS